MPTSRRGGGQSPACDVVVGREPHRLRGNSLRGSLEDAAALSLITRRKVEGIWLYAADESTLDHAADQVLKAALHLCRTWFLAPMRPLAGKLAKDLGSVVTMEAARPLIRAHVRAGRLSAIAALTGEYEPHLLVHDPADRDQLDQAIGNARRMLAEHGAVSAAALPALSRQTTLQAWRSHLLSHLEWAGAGRASDSRLISWAAP